MGSKLGGIRFNYDTIFIYELVRLILLSCSIASGEYDMMI